MRIHTIESKKQDNGLWGTPMNLHSMGLYNYNVFEHNNELLLSAIIIKFDEIYNTRFSITVFDDFVDFTTDDNKKFQTRFKDHEVIGNKLYFFNGDEDKKDFNRMLKLNKLCGGLTK